MSSIRISLSFCPLFSLYPLTTFCHVLRHHHHFFGSLFVSVSQILSFLLSVSLTPSISFFHSFATVVFIFNHHHQLLSVEQNSYILYIYISFLHLFPTAILKINKYALSDILRGTITKILKIT